MRVRFRRVCAVVVGAMLLVAPVAGCGEQPGAEVVAAPAGDDGAAPLVGADGPAAPPDDPADRSTAGATPEPTRPASEDAGSERSASKSARDGAAPAGQPPRKPPPVRDVGAPIRKDNPPPMPQPPPTGCTPTYVGPQASRAEVKAALTDAGTRVYWTISAPSLMVPVDLVKAVAWQESGWQSNIVACDGGVGLMQVMPDTADFVNMRFDESYDINDYRDNAPLGANYLAWLIKFFADSYFERNYEITADDCASTTDLCLLNLVIAAYNYGPYAVDTAAGLVIPNPQYVRNVRALMTECVCLTY